MKSTWYKRHFLTIQYTIFFNIYNLDTYSGDYSLLKDGSDDQPDLSYKYPSEEYKNFIDDK